MPRSRVMDYMMMRRDGRNPYGSRGGYVRDSRRGGYDRNYRDYGDTEYDTRRGDRAYSQQDNARGRRDYEYDRQSDMARGSYDMRGQNYKGEEVYSREEMDGHYVQGRGGENYRPVEAMGYFSGYAGMQDGFYPRVRQGRDYGDYDDDMRGRDYESDMRRNRDYNDMRGRDYAGDYGENLTKEELEHWKKKLMEEVDEKDKQHFKKETISQKARQMGLQMKDYNEDELLVTTLMMYTDYCKTMKPLIGSNMDIYIKLARDWLEDDDVSVKGGEKLAIYYDCIVEGI